VAGKKMSGQKDFLGNGEIEPLMNMHRTPCGWSAWGPDCTRVRTP
jgi:hypothetical protein